MPTATDIRTFLSEHHIQEVECVIPDMTGIARGKIECEPLRDVLGGAFVDAFLAVKELEYATYNRVIGSWEREHLLLLV